MQINSKNHRLKGFTLIELVFVLAISAIAMVGIYRVATSESRNLVLRAHATQMLTFGRALEAYAVKNYRALAQGGAVAGFADAMHPTAAELTAAHYLPLGWRPSDAFGGQYVANLTRIGSDCATEMTDCKIEGIAYSSLPLVEPGTTRVAQVDCGYVVQQIGGEGGCSSVATPGVISGWGGQWSQPNPTNRAGIVAVRAGRFANGIDLTMIDQTYYRRDGAKPLTRDLNIDGHNVLGAGRLSATGDVQAGTTVSAGSDVQAGNNVLAANDVTGGGNLRIGGTSTLMGNVGVGKAPDPNPDIGLSVRARTETWSLVNNNKTSGGTSCGDYKPGAQATGADGRLYVCRNGQWSAAGGWDGPSRYVAGGAPSTIPARCESMGNLGAQACINGGNVFCQAGGGGCDGFRWSFTPGSIDTQTNTWYTYPIVLACYEEPTGGGPVTQCASLSGAIPGG